MGDIVTVSIGNPRTASTTNFGRANIVRTLDCTDRARQRQRRQHCEISLKADPLRELEQFRNHRGMEL